jgi:hypothetical protein
MDNSATSQIQRNNSNFVFLVFLFSPLIALILSVKQYKEKWGKNIVWMFSTFYGYSFVIGNEGSDINRYKKKFLLHYDMQMSVGDYFNFLMSEGTFDFIQPLLSFITSLFTSDFKIYLLLIGAIFGFFLSRNIWTVLSLGKKKPMWYGLLFILVFSFIYAVWDINVMRFTLATHIFFYGWIKLLLHKNKWGYLFMVLAILVHFSFTIAIAFCVFYQSSLKWAVGILLTTIYVNRKKIKDNFSSENLLAFCLMFVGIFNILSVIPSMNRFQFVSYLFAFTLFYSYFNGEINYKEKRIIYLCTPLILFYFVMKVRIGFEFIGLLTLLGGPFVALIKDGDIAMIEFLK